MKTEFRVALLALLILLFGSVFFLNSQSAVAAEESVDNYAKLCSNQDGIVWNTDNPLPPLSPCMNPGTWVAVSFGPSDGPYETKRFDGYLALFAEAEEYQWGTVWYEPNYALLCVLGYAYGWDENNPLPKNSPCTVPGTWNSYGFGPSNGKYEPMSFVSYSLLLDEASKYQWGTVWFQPDYAALCSNQDGIVWNTDNPLPPLSPCMNPGTWVAVSFGPSDGPYETKRFDGYLALFAEAEEYQWGTVWFENAPTPALQNPVYLPFVAGPPGQTLCRQGKRSASCEAPIEPRN